MKIIFVFTLVAVSISACSHQSYYDGLQERERIMCRQVPPSEYQDCIKQQEKSYSEYEKQREDAIKQETEVNPDQQQD